MPSVQAAIARQLRTRGVDAVFGMLGDDVAALGVELQGAGIDYYATRHEAAAVQMADGYSRASGRLGVALVTCGPGFTNALTAITIAARARSRVLVVTCESDPAIRGTVYSKWVNQPLLLQGVEVKFETIADPERAVADFEVLCDAAAAGVGTVVASLRVDVLPRAAGDAPSALTFEAPRPVAPDPEQIAFAVDVLAESWAFTRPLLLAGRGAVRAGAGDALVRLGRSLGALLGTTLMARAYFAGEDYDIGVCGTFSTTVAVELLQETDLVIAVGATVDEYTTLNGALFPRARVFQVDADPAAPVRASVEPELFIHGDALLATTALVDGMEERGVASVGYRNQRTAEILLASEPRRIEDEGCPGALDPRVVMRRLERLLPRDKVLVVDGGHHMSFAIGELGVERPEDFILPLEFYSIGSATGIALGAAVALPEKTVVYAAGDAGLMMSLPDLETAARYGIGVVVLVTNDSALGSEVHLLHDLGLPDDVARIPTPSFAAVGQALGGTGLTLDRIEDVDALGDRLVGPRGPVVVDIRVTTEVRADERI